MAFIGKNVIENLTTAMYEDLRIIYREYVQNSADSIDCAIRKGVLTKEEAKIDIEINAKKRYVSVTDNAMGIPCGQFLQIMSSIADSTKDRGEDKGFRGIGRLGGISSCETLIFSCSAPGEPVVSVCKWNAKRVREILVDKKQNPSAAELVDAVTEFSQNEYDANDHIFKVELELYRRLRLNVDLCQELGANIYSFPMKYHPIEDPDYFSNRDYIGKKWNRKFIRTIQAILNSTKGKVGRSYDFFCKAFGADEQEFYKLLYMPEEMIIYRFYFEEIGMTDEWWQAFTSLTEEELRIVKPIIEHNDFNNIEEKTDNPNILRVLEYYCITKEETERARANSE